MEAVRRKKLTKKGIQLTEVIKHNSWGGCTWFLHRSTIHNWCQTTQDEGHSRHVSKKIVFSTWWLSILRMPLHTNMLCKRLIVY